MSKKSKELKQFRKLVQAVNSRGGTAMVLYIVDKDVWVNGVKLTKAEAKDFRKKRGAWA